jgi:hypothetical protein
VTGARHLRAARNGQDAAVVWLGGDAGCVVVGDGCGSGASSEVGARLGARLVLAAVVRRLAAGDSPADREMWHAVRAEVVGVLDDLVRAAVGEGDAAARAAFIEEHFLFTIVAAAIRGGEAAVWALGDGAYLTGARTRELGPFEDNQPPYLAYDLLGMPQTAEHEVIDATAAGAVLVATDGAAEVGLDVFGVEWCLAHPDALRRRLTVLARGGEQIDWAAKRVVRTPAVLQDDGAVAILAWRGRPS